MGWKLVIYWKTFICVCTKGLHLIKRHFWEAGCCLTGHQFQNQHQQLIGRKRACVFLSSQRDLLGSHHLLSDNFLLSPQLTWPNGWGRWTHCAGGQIEKLRGKRSYHMEKDLKGIEVGKYCYPQGGEGLDQHLCASLECCSYFNVSAAL